MTMENINKIVNDQMKLCAKYGSQFCPPSPSLLASVSKNIGEKDLPLQGLRHPLEGASGWFLWRGEFSLAEDFFEVVHLYHVYEGVEPVIPYLALAPGWTFFLQSDFEDVWFDESLLEV